MGAVRIIIGMKNEASLVKMKEILQGSGYIVVEEAKDGRDCLRKIKALKPDLSIFEMELPTMDGLEIARVLQEEKLGQAIVITGASPEQLSYQEDSEQEAVILPKPLNKASLLTMIQILVKHQRKVAKLEKDIEELRVGLDTRKEVERAKGLLMKNMNLSEPEAFKRIQKQSMDRGISMKEIAKAIIVAYDI